ncbi:hypothetical protein TG4357_01094 [Thalassovita gelatinovora]|uniref:DUF3299 domain-containing protein n=1 Tax=Thalassovita gelatinovora TaxID=53501 RepID=A0A0P1F7W9_THAGE|nr:hypothetical protein [Thalassovita gelatinovora]QIZ80257.1 hypothetical protein HFZ77_07120 [Thalassovita gelatinovora]CUH64129.1 hypothetical protein TG4357_01094 [Thalassovita gelatinovora]SEQ84005.1 hypothetical protein SAMN04488043_109135 [Thalassovita gelatinovora]
MQTSRYAFAAVFSAAATTASAQPDAWHLLNQIGIEEIITDTSYEVRKTYPAGLEQGSRNFEITGYAAPMIPGETVRDLIMVSDMGLCPLCGGSDHGANLQITLADPIAMTDDSVRITVRGTLNRIDDPETWQAVILQDAQIVAR